MGEVLDESGYHIIALQEARMDRLAPLGAPARWSFAEDEYQFLSACQPADVSLLVAGTEPKAIAWAFFHVYFGAPRADLFQLNILSLHLNNHRAKKPEAPVNILKEVPFFVRCSFVFAR